MSVDVAQASDVDADVIDRIVAAVLAHIARTTTMSVSPPAVRDRVEREWARYDTATVRTFLPVLVLRAVVGDIVIGAD